MLKRFSFLLVLLFLSFNISGCVSEAVNKAIGSLLKDPNALENPEKPDDPIFNPQSEKLVVPSEADETQNRFQNKPR